jgi:hypothetical protein
MRKTGFEFAAVEYHPETRRSLDNRRSESPTSIFQMPKMTMGNAQSVLEKALSLARRARVEGWCAEYLTLRFEEFVTLQGGKKGRGRKILVEYEVL